MPQVDADLVLGAGRMGLEYAEPNIEHAKGGGERLKGLSGALLDALERWITRGTPPPASRFNGVRLDANGDGVVEALTFPQASGPPTSLYGFVDDPAEDALTAPRTVMTVAANPLPVSRWLAAQDALAPTPDSVILAETACRRGGVTLVTPGPVGTWFRPYDEQTFHAKWGSTPAYQTCRVLNADALIADGLYDPRVVTVDIVPDTFPNVIDLQADPKVTVAIFSTRRFDATRIDPSSLGMGGATLPGDDDDGRRKSHGSCADRRPGSGTSTATGGSTWSSTSRPPGCTSTITISLLTSGDRPSMVCRSAAPISWTSCAERVVRPFRIPLLDAPLTVRRAAGTPNPAATSRSEYQFLTEPYTIGTIGPPGGL